MYRDAKLRLKLLSWFHVPGRLYLNKYLGHAIRSVKTYGTETDGQTTYLDISYVTNQTNQIGIKIFNYFPSRHLRRGRRIG